MKSNIDKIKKVVANVIEEITDIDSLEWPPTCSCVLFQPLRPTVPYNKAESLDSQ